MSSDSKQVSSEPPSTCCQTSRCALKDNVVRLASCCWCVHNRPLPGKHACVQDCSSIIWHGIHSSTQFFPSKASVALVRPVPQFCKNVDLLMQNFSSHLAYSNKSASAVLTSCRVGSSRADHRYPMC